MERLFSLSQLIRVENSFEHLLFLVFIFLVSLISFSFLRKLFWSAVKNAMAHICEKQSLDLFCDSLQTPSRVLSFLGALVVTVLFLPTPARSEWSLGIKIASILVLGWTLNRALTSLFDSRISLIKVSQTMRTLILTVLRISLFSLACLIVLDNLGISITPILASLGVGSVAVALALQETLSNFFSGIYLLIDEPIRLGDFVQVESGIEGHVVKVGWRSTHIKMPSNNIVVIPNSKIASQRLINYDLQDRETAVVVQVGVAYDSDLEKVERVTEEVAKDILSRVEGGVDSFDPFIRYHTLNESSINFSVVLRARHIEDQNIVKHELIKALVKRYAREGITMPFPQRDVHLFSKTIS